MNRCPQARLASFTAAAACALLTTWNATAAAQSTPDSRVSIAVVGSERVTTTAVTQSVTFEQYAEMGSLTTVDQMRRHFVPAVSVVVRVWEGFGVGVSASWCNESTPGRIVAQVPNPFVYGRLREVAGQVDLGRTERVRALQAVYWMQPGQHLELILSAGPSLVRVDQDFVTDIAYTQAYPFDTATFQSASVQRRRRSVAGWQAGADIGWRASRHFSVTATAQYSRATAMIADTASSPLTLGGLDLGGGLRARF